MGLGIGIFFSFSSHSFALLVNKQGLGMAHLVNPFSIRVPSKEQNKHQLLKSFFVVVVFACNNYQTEGQWREWRVRVDAFISGFVRFYSQVVYTSNGLGVSVTDQYCNLNHHLPVSILRSLCSWNPQQNLLKWRWSSDEPKKLREGGKDLVTKNKNSL